MKDAINVLLVTNSTPLLRSFQSAMKDARNGNMYHAKSKAEAIQWIREKPFQIVLSDSSISTDACLDLLADVREKKIDLPIVLLVDSERDQLATKGLDQGAYDYIVKGKDQFKRVMHLLHNIRDRHQQTLREHRLKEDLARQKSELRAINQRLEAFAIHDELTGVYNHRYCQEKLNEEYLRAKRYSQPLSSLMIDLDFFKTVNDTNGHAVGDEVLKEISQLLVELSRDVDVVARYGGEEFVVLLPHIGCEGAFKLAERMRKEVEQKVFLAGSLNLKITVSIGVSSFPDDLLQRHDDLILFAEKALVRAKSQRQRNTVCCYTTLLKEIEDQTPDLKFSEEKMNEFRKRLVNVSETAKKAYIEYTKALIYALEAKDKYTLGHASRVAQYSAVVAKQMQLPEDEVVTVEHAGLLHDIGKVCISDEILLKPGAFTNAEYEKMRDHPVLGYQIVKSIKFLREEALIILHHHEWYDGSGYPHRLKGKEILIGARIVSVIDAYDTMHAAGGRYKKTLTVLDSIYELVKYAGTQFDAEVVDALTRALEGRGEIDGQDSGIKKLHDKLSEIISMQGY